MNEPTQHVVQQAVLTLIEETVTESKVQRSFKLHHNKIHFIPVQYRVLGGLLQSLNIKFGNFIEKLIALAVDIDTQVEALPASGKKIRLAISAETDQLIDQYISGRQQPDSPDNCDVLFADLLNQIVTVELQSKQPKPEIRQDVDALFRAANGQIVYLEIKYNDDHDTGKFVNINRKFLKTYAGLINYLSIEDVQSFKPILYYFNPTKRWGPIYVPSSNIYRGRQLFNEYFEMPFADIDGYLRQLGTNQDTIAIFDRLYERIRHNT